YSKVPAKQMVGTAASAYALRVSSFRPARSLPFASRRRPLSLSGVRPDARAVLDTLRRLVDMRVGIVDAHAVGARMLLHDVDHRIVGLLAGPVALPHEQH